MVDVSYFWRVERYSQGDLRTLGPYASIEEAKQAAENLLSRMPRTVRWQRLGEHEWQLVEGDGAFTCYTVERWYTEAGSAEAKKG